MHNLSILEGGAAIGDTTSQVPKQYLNSTIKQGLKDAGLSGMKFNVVGNVSSDFLGDVDISVDIEELSKKWNLPKPYYSTEFWEAIKNKIQKLQGSKVTTGLKIFHIPAKLVDDSGKRLPSYKNGKEIPNTEGTIQIDIFVGNLDWMKDILSGKTQDSNFKAVFRNIFLLTIVSTIGRYKTKPNTKGEFEEHKYALQISSGVEKVITKYVPPTGRAKKPQIASVDRKPFITDQNELATWIFGKGKTWKDIDSFEKIANNFEQNSYFNKKYGNYKEEIIDKLKQGYSTDQLEQIKNGGFGHMFNLEEKIKENLLLEGGAAGHMDHLYDNGNLTFGKIKEIFNAAAEGKLEGTEKTDGQNLMISYSVKEGKAKGVRNASDIKHGGLNPDELWKKFSEHANPKLKETFSEALMAFQKVINSFSHEQQIQLFGPDTNIFYNAEVMDSRAPNTVNYDTKTLVIHRVGHFEFDRENNKKTDRNLTNEAAKLEKAINDLQDKLKHENYGIQVNAVRKLQALSDKKPLYTAINNINKLLSDVNRLVNNEQLNLSDTSTIDEFMLSRIYILINSILAKGKIKLQPIIKMNITKKIAGVKGINKSDIKKNISSDDLEFIETHLLSDASKKDIYNTAIQPLELIVSDFAVEMLKGLQSAFVLDNEKEIQRLKIELKSAIEEIEKSTNDEKMFALRRQVAKVKSADNVSAAAEGFVFDYDGMTYKFTGNFAPMNQILGFFKYKEPKDKKTLSEVKTTKPLGKTIAVIPGAFKPPHKGHLKMVQEYAKIADEIIIFMSPHSRESNKGMQFSFEMSKILWEEYLKSLNLNNKVKVIMSSARSPLISAFDFVSNKENNPDYAQSGQTVILGVSTKGGDEKRFTDDIYKHAKKGVKAIIKPLPPMGNISATDFREAIEEKNISKIIKFIPDSIKNKKKFVQTYILKDKNSKEISESYLYDIIKESISFCGKYSLLKKKKKVKKENSSAASVGGYGMPLMQKGK